MRQRDKPDGQGLPSERGVPPLEGAPFSRIYHYSYLSTFARHAVVDERSCVPLPADADLEVACLVGCAVTTGMGAVINKAKVAPGSSVIIFGAGGVGLSALIAAQLAGAGEGRRGRPCRRKAPAGRRAGC